MRSTWLHQHIRWCLSLCNLHVHHSLKYNFAITNYTTRWVIPVCMVIISWYCNTIPNACHITSKDILIGCHQKLVITIASASWIWFQLNPIDTAVLEIKMVLLQMIDILTVTPESRSDEGKINRIFFFLLFLTLKNTSRIQWRIELEIILLSDQVIESFNEQILHLFCSYFFYSSMLNWWEVKAVQTKERLMWMHLRRSRLTKWPCSLCQCLLLT